MKVKDVMTEDVKSINVPGNREKAVEVLEDMNINTIPVINKDSKKLSGVIRLRNLFENPDENQIGVLMDRNVLSIQPEEDLQTTSKQMIKNNSRRAFIVNENEELKGVITVRDILHRVLTERKTDTEVRKCMQRKITSLWEQTPLNVAAEIIHLSGERALPVLDDNGEPAGMIGDEDIMKVSSIEEEKTRDKLTEKSETGEWTWDYEDTIYITKKSLKLPEKKVSEVMTKDLITVSKRSTANKCAELMAEHNLNQMPVISGKRMVGMVSDEDLLKTLNS